MSTEYIELRYGTCISDDCRGSKFLVTSDNIVLKEIYKKWRGFKTYSNKIESELTDSLFQVVESENFQSIPANVDANCDVSVKYPNGLNTIYLGGENTFQHGPALKTLTIKTNDKTKSMQWKNCKPLPKEELESLESKYKNGTLTLEQYQKVIKQNEIISNNIVLLSNLIETISDLTDEL